MSKGKHTEGPWGIFGPTGIGIHTQYLIRHESPRRSGGSFATINTLHSTDEALETCAANARLIAAAPDMLEALKGWEIIFNTREGAFVSPMVKTCLKETLAAIAKATEPQQPPVPSA